MIKLQVTGSRTWGGGNYLNYEDWEKVAVQLSNAQAKFGNDLVVIEGHAIGLDIMVYALCIQMGIAVQAMPANWEKYGKAAGPIRNQQMIDEHRADFAVAFSHDLTKSRGTTDMLKRLKHANIPTRTIQ
jgi:hypothetical protein